MSRLPLSWLYVMADVVRPVVRLVYRRRVVRDNLRSSFPDKSDVELNKIESDFYRQFCDNIVETLKSLSMSKEEMMNRMTFTRVDYVERELAAGKDCMLSLLGHYGNWEWLASVSYWMPFAHCCQIYKPLSSAAADDFFLKMRQGYGGECISMENSYRRLLSLRREGRKIVLGSIADQLPQWKGIHHFVRFLSHDTAVFTGTEQMAKKLNSFVMYARVTKRGRGYYSCELVPLSENPSEEPDYAITDRYMKMLEDDIMTAPAMWLWTHKRWLRTREEWERRKATNLTCS